MGPNLRCDSSTLTSLAIVKVNWDNNSQSYSDSFVPFVVAGLHALGVPSGASAVRDQIAASFGLQLPDGVVSNLLDRSRRSGYASQDSGRAYHLTEKGGSFSERFREQSVILNRRRNRLVAALMADGSALGRELTPDGAEDALLGFIELHSAPLLAGLVRGDVSAIPRIQQEGLEYLVAQFVVRVIEGEPELAQYLADVVKGSMLSASLYAVGAGEVDRRFRSTILFLDTPLILKALGHEGERSARPVLELIDLAREAGAAVACFEHSVQEARGVLHGVADVLKGGRRPPTMRGVLAHYLEINSSSSDALERIGSMDEDLSNLRIAVRERPPHERDLTVDEGALRVALESAIRYTRPSAIDHDLDSLTAVHRLRNGRRVEQVERCRAALVTDNTSLVSAAQRFFRDQEGASIGPALLDHNVTTLLWVKRPQAAPDLPLRQILADSYALLDPGPAMWRAYMDKIDALRDRAEISPADVTELRFSMEAHRALMDQTGGDSSRVSRAVVQASLAASRDAAAAPEREGRLVAEAEVRDERRRAQDLGDSLAEASRGVAELRASLAEMEGRVNSQRAAIASRAARDVRRGLLAGLTIAIAIGVASVLMPAIPGIPPALAGVLRAVGSVITLAGVVTLVLGGSIRSLAARVESPLTRHRIASLERRAFLEPEVGGPASVSRTL